MPKVGYSEEERERIRAVLVTTALEQMARQGIQHTTVEQIYTAAGISRTLFYTFFPTKEDLIVETLYFQQPKILAYARSLMDDPSLTWREGVERFLYTCCYGERNGIAVLTAEDQQRLFRRLSPESCRLFRERQLRLFGDLLEIFGVQADTAAVRLFTNISLLAMVTRRAIPAALPLFVPEAADETVAFQIRAITDALASMRTADIAP